MISYAQNFEDVMLHRCFHDRKTGFYIDVGAWDPVVDSVTKIFYDEGWSGVNVEPNELFYERLREERPRDINLNLAIGEREESRLLYVFEQYGNSTFDPSHRDRFVEQGYEAKEKIVRTTTLASICQQYADREIDFLKIDCEGWENVAIRGADWERFQPAVVIVEATEPMTTNPSWSEWEPVLTGEGRYQFVYFDGLNRFYLRHDCSGLRQHFEKPPNVFDDFTTYATLQARQGQEALRHERNTLAARSTDLERETQSLAAERDQLATQLTELEAQLADAQQQVAALEQKVDEVDQRFRTMRLWVGQLSQELVQTRRRLAG